MLHYEAVTSPRPRPASGRGRVLIITAPSPRVWRGRDLAGPSVHNVAIMSILSRDARAPGNTLGGRQGITHDFTQNSAAVVCGVPAQHYSTTTASQVKDNKHELLSRRINGIGAYDCTVVSKLAVESVNLTCNFLGFLFLIFSK